MTSTVTVPAVSLPEQRRSGSEEAFPTTPFQASKRLPSWAAFRADAETLRVTVDHKAKWRTVERALAYGLSHAGDRRLTLEFAPFRGGRHNPVQATCVRAAFLTAPVEVIEGGFLSAELKEDEALALVHEDRLRSEVCNLAERASWLAGLMAWADVHPDLRPAHRKQYLAWHCAGRQLLQIKLKGRGLELTAGVNYTKPKSGQIPPLKEDVVGVLSAELLDRLVATVETGIAARLGTTDVAATDLGHAEHRLQAAMAEAPALLGWKDDQALIREFPARRPGGGIGFVDFLRVDSDGVLHIVETKIGHDAMLVLQGLDYWIWVKANRKALQLELGMPVNDVVIDYVVATKDDHPYDAKADWDGLKLLSPYNLAHLRALRSDIRWRVHALSGWKTGELVLTSLGQHERAIPGAGKSVGG